MLKKEITRVTQQSRQRNIEDWTLSITRNGFRPWLQELKRLNGLDGTMPEMYRALNICKKSWRFVD
jgi:hypothetical protein